MHAVYRSKAMPTEGPLLDQDASLTRTRDHRGRLRFLLQDRTPVYHTVVNGNEHIFMPLDKCMLSVMEPNPDPKKLTAIIHFNHVIQDCSLGNMCWATRHQRRDYYTATKDLRTDPKYLEWRRTRLVYRVLMRRYRRAQKEFRQFGRVVHMPDLSPAWA